MELMAYEQSLCGGCGKHPDETSGKANTFRWAAEVRYCHACKASDMVRAQLRKEGAPAGAMIVVREAHGWRG